MPTLKRLGAEERANRLLLQHLSIGQKRTWNAKGYIDVVGRDGKYRVFGRSARMKMRWPRGYMTVFRLPPSGRINAKGAQYLRYWNAWAFGFNPKTKSSMPIPEADEVLAYKIGLEAVGSECVSMACGDVIGEAYLVRHMLKLGGQVAHSRADGGTKG